MDQTRFTREDVGVSLMGLVDLVFRLIVSGNVSNKSSLYFTRFM